jgi:hypothetical protein
MFTPHHRYVLADRIHAEFSEMDKALRTRLCDPIHGAEVQRMLVQLVNRGLRWNALGLDMADLSDPSPAELTLLHELSVSLLRHYPLHPAAPLLSEFQSILRIGTSTSK